ncbi:MAG: 5'-deoxynucleotidase [Ruminococcaceae bacterium]|nr:5'-deoxynucleotidase [Oscillospiraceae bacterium]
MNYSFYALISRIKNINRWALMRNSSTENVQEHSHMTAVIAHALCVISRDVYGNDVDPNLAAAEALFHDATEIFTGDLPTPVKYYGDEITSAYRRIEDAACDSLLGSLPESLRPAYEELLKGRTPERVHLLVKAADKLSAYIKCLEELRCGNGEFRAAAAQTKEKLEKMDLPEVRYFMEKFIGAFELTLDELSF